MIDRKKTIEHLSDLKERLKFQKDVQGYGFYIDFINDAIALLMKQEPVKPEFLPDRKFGCPDCKSIIKFGNPYCWNCGRQVTWE